MLRPVCLAALLVVTATAAYAQTSKLVYSESPPVWFEAHNISAAISPDGRTALIASRWPESVKQIDAATGVMQREPLNLGLDQVRSGAFTARGELALLGRLGTEPVQWYLSGPTRPLALDIPGSATPAWNSTGEVAYFLRGRADSGVTVVSSTRGKRLDVPGTVSGSTWLDSDQLLVLASDTLGASSLYRINSTTGRRTLVAGALNADPVNSRIAVARDRRHAYIALAGPTISAAEGRHEPFADRDLDIYEINLSTGALRPVITTEADETAPFVVGDELYWTSSRFESSVVVVPIGGGAARHVVQHAMHPAWHPNGRMLGVVYGAFRAADWALNWDGGSIDVAAKASATAITPVLANYHEDFEPNWSPDGNWIAYHSHRSEKPVVSYSAAGSTDDIWLKRTGSTEQIRLTRDKWEVGSPDWSRDGARLVYTGWDTRRPGRTYASIITLEPATGRMLNDVEIPLGEIPSAETAVWAPTVDEVAIEAVRAPGRRELWTVRPDGSSARKIVDYVLHTYGGVSWTPDGRTLIFPSIVDDRMQLFKVMASGGPAVQLTHDAAHLLHPRVSPDGQWIAATRLLNTKEIRRARLGVADLRAIDLRRAVYERAAGSGDFEGVVQSYTPDAVLLPPGRDPVRGSAAIRAFQSADRYRLAHDIFELDIRGDRAYEIGKWARRGTDGVVQVRGWYYWVWRRQRDGIWAIERDLWSRSCGPQTGSACP